MLMSTLLVVVLISIVVNNKAVIIYRDDLVNITNGWAFVQPWDAPIDSNDCPFDSTTCFQIGGGGRFSKPVSTIGFKNIKVEFDMNMIRFDGTEHCRLMYSTSGSQWQTIGPEYGEQTVYEIHGNVSFTDEILFPVDPSENNNAKFKIMFRNWANEVTELCFISKLVISGTYIAIVTPTLYPSYNPTYAPTISPETNLDGEIDEQYTTSD
eukprot:289217_1